jgi:arabinan endo-1,5-alpha-L-arabinosidase
VNKRIVRISILGITILAVILLVVWIPSLVSNRSSSRTAVVKGQTTMAATVPPQVEMQGDLRAHDPSLIREGNVYYVFSTGGSLAIRTSTDLLHWQVIGTVFDAVPSWVSQTVGREVKDLWAPDISYVNGVYYLYYCGSVFGKNTSVIGLATNTTLDPTSPHYHWTDRGAVIQSSLSDDFNAIDPNLSIDAQGNPWLAFGSFWTGIKLRRLDPHTFKPSSSDTTFYALAANPAGGDAIEAPFIIYRNGYYYLFASIDKCCSGADSTYKTVVGRSSAITGPYLNKDGNPMGQNADFTILLTGYSNVRGPGGESVYRDRGNDLLIHHYYDANEDGAIKFFIRKLLWSSDGWPSTSEPLYAVPKAAS